MSTKCTVAYNDKEQWHLYWDMMVSDDDSELYLECHDADFECSPKRIELKLPDEISRILKKHYDGD